MSPRVSCYPRAMLIAVLLCAAFPLSGHTQERECNEPESLGAVLGYIRGRMPTPVIVSRLERGCASFRMGEEERDALLEAGATEELLAAIGTAFDGGRVRYVPPMTNRFGLPVAGTLIALVPDWVRVDGTRMYYRYETYLDVPCSDRIRAVGNWANYGWDYRNGIRVECLDEAWLSFDFEEMLESLDLSG
jgi:hypothetical protein